MENKRQERSYGVVPVYKKNNEHLFLVVLHNSGHWGFPKGHMEPEDKESAIKTAKRELKEETGIASCDIIEEPSFTENYVFSKEGENVRKSVEYFLGIVNNPTVKILKAELSGYKWAPYKEAFDTITFDENKKILKEAKQYLNTNNIC